MQECKQNTPLCQCIDWKSGDISVGVNHFINHFDFQGFTLEYSTLEPEKDRRMCKIGRCVVCGKRLCIGRALPAECGADDFLSEVYNWMFQMWKGPRERLPDGVNCFRDMFLSLFHEEDKDYVHEWLRQPGNQKIAQAGRLSEKEGG